MVGLFWLSNRMLVRAGQGTLMLSSWSGSINLQLCAAARNVLLMRCSRAGLCPMTPRLPLANVGLMMSNPLEPIFTTHRCHSRGL